VKSSLFKLAQILDSRNLYSLADKVDRIAQNTLTFKSDQELTNYLNSIVGKNGIASFAQAMDSAANSGANVNGVSIKNIPQFQAKYKESMPKMPMMPGMPMPGMPMPVAPMPGMPMPMMPMPVAPMPMPVAKPAPIAPMPVQNIAPKAK
jgi:hypothetical protein